MSISFSTGTREWQASAPQERNLPKRPWGISASHLKLQSLKGCFRLGFIRAVWIDIAQGISGAHGMALCSVMDVRDLTCVQNGARRQVRQITVTHAVTRLQNG